MEPVLILLDTNILIDVLRGEEVALRWLEAQGQASISVITWIEVLVGCRQRHGLKVPDAILLATAVCAGFPLATRNTRDFPLALGGVVHPYGL